METPVQEKPQLKIPELRAFKSIQKNFAMAGISRELMIQSYPLNERIVTGFLLLSSTLVFICVYILNDAETFFEYTQSIYIASVATLFIFALFILIMVLENVFEFIDRCDCILNTSK